MRTRQVVDHVAQDFFRRLEAERRWIADVELEDAVALLLEPVRFGLHRAANVVADIGELGGLVNRRLANGRQAQCGFVGIGHGGVLFGGANGSIAIRRGSNPRRERHG